MKLGALQPYDELIVSFTSSLRDSKFSTEGILLLIIVCSLVTSTPIRLLIDANVGHIPSEWITCAPSRRRESATGRLVPFAMGPTAITIS